MCNLTASPLFLNLYSLDHHCWKKEINLYGGDIKQVSFTTVEACKEDCAKTEGCVSFTTEAGENNKCWLKNKDHAGESAKAIAVSVRMSCYEGKCNLNTYMF